MMRHAPVIDGLIRHLGKFPGIGQRSAQRIALHLLRHKESLMLPLAEALRQAAETIHACTTCGNYDQVDPCHICTDDRRDRSQLCVVEDIADLWAIERGHVYRGLYHVLGGTLSAIDGRGPDALNIPSLIRRVAEGKVKEVILATNATVEGQTTAHFLTAQLTDYPVTITGLAQGIPMGGELDYLDDGTLGAALAARKAYA